MLVLDGSTGQNAYEQAKQFIKATDVTSLAITKLDGTAKGGVVIGISHQLKVPVKYIGLGEKMTDLQPFNRKDFVNSSLKVTNYKARPTQQTNKMSNNQANNSYKHTVDIITMGCSKTLSTLKALSTSLKSTT